MVKLVEKERDNDGHPREMPSDGWRPDFAPNAGLPRHRWYRFKEGFSAGLVRNFIEEHASAQQSLIFDPFLGSGTVAVEGALLGHTVHGVEANPFMTFLSLVKSRDYSRLFDLEGLALRCLQCRERDAEFALPEDTTLVERKGLEKWLLNGGVGRRFEELRTAINRLSPRAVGDLLLLALMSSIESVSNARKDGKCWRYKRGWKQRAYSASDLDNAFAGQILLYADDVRSCPRLNGSVKITQGDARRLTKLAALSRDAKYDAILTSPPYLNSFDYTDIYRPELLLLKKARNAEELRDLRFSTLRSHVQVAWSRSDPLNIPLLQQKVLDVGRAALWCGRIPDMINAYFVDLDRVIKECALRLKPSAPAGFVVADSAYVGVVIPVGLILCEILERRGFIVESIRVLRHRPGNGNHQRRSSEGLREVIICSRFRGARLARSRARSGLV
jgi:hypothetical protein